MKIPSATIQIRTCYYRILYQWILGRSVFGPGIKIGAPLSIMGPGRVLWGPNCLTSPGPHRKKGVSIVTHTPEARVVIGEGTILRGTSIGCADEINIGPRCLLDDAHLIDADLHPKDPKARQEAPSIGLSEPITIGFGTYVGPQAVIMKGATIGDGGTIMAGSTLGKRTVGDGGYVRGCPATFLRPTMPHRTSHGPLTLYSSSHRELLHPSVDISVIIPTYRRPNELLEALHSVLAVRNLSFEILVGDDSMERSAQPVVASLADRQITYMPMNPPTGGFPGRVRNQLARMARGKYLYFLDDDDRVNPMILPDIVKTMAKKGAQIAVCDVSPFGDDGPSLVHEKNYFLSASRTLSQRLSPELMVAWLLFRDPLLVTSACVITRDAFVDLGGFDETLSHFEDTEFFLRAIRDFGYLYIPSPLVERRCGQVSLSRSLTNQQIAGFYRRIRKKYQYIHGIREFTTLRLCAALAAKKKVEDPYTFMTNASNPSK